MKHMMRRPLLPVLLLVVLCVSSAFLAQFQAGIWEDQRQIEALYNTTQLTIELLPGVDSQDQLRLQTHKGDFLEDLESIRSTLRVMECDALTEGTAVRIYGTNNLSWLAKYKMLDIANGAGYADIPFVEADGRIPCVLGESLSEKMGLAVGDAVIVTPVSFTGQPTESAPQVELTVIGVCSDPEHLMNEGIIVPEEIFLNGPRLLYNPDMMYDCYYRSFVLELEPSWNRSFETVEDSVKEILYDLDEFELVSNHRTLRRSVGPMERKLAVQEKLILPLELLFLMACAGISILICIGLEAEIFLRRMWGETGGTVFARLWCCIVLWLLTCAAAAVAVTALTAGAQWLRWAICYAGAGSIACAVVSAIPLLRSCRRNLVEFYQIKEGE